MSNSGNTTEKLRLMQIHSIEALVSIASNLLTIGIFFFMQHRFGWTLLQNFLLSAGLGAVYIVGALAAHGISQKLGRRMALLAAYSIIIVITLFAGLFTSPMVCTIVILAFAATSATTWPVIENLVSTGDADPHALSRRLATYNAVWAAVGALVMAVNGTIIEKFPTGVFLIPCAVVCAAAGIVALGKIEANVEGGEWSVEGKKDGFSNSPPSTLHPPPASPEPQLLRQRVLALWLSRICVPAMYLMIYSLAAMLPSLPVVQPLRPAMQTLLSSIWMAVRWGTFITLGASIFWHTRPRLLLVAAFALLISFLIITVPQSVGLMIVGQILFGIATGLIYTASLYFGMVLSEGSTEHGGYHEALIGLGMTLGPAVGAGTGWIFPQSQGAAVVAISALIGVSVLVASAASLRLRRKDL
jgi:MFS family permease